MHMLSARCAVGKTFVLSESNIFCQLFNLQNMFLIYIIYRDYGLNSSKNEFVQIYIN